MANVTMGYYNQPDPNSQMYQQGGSTIGAIGGAALGSVVPGIGTAIGGALGSGIGGALGGLLGGGGKKKKVQQKIFIPNWTGVPTRVGESVSPEPQPNSALSGGINGLLSGASMPGMGGGNGFGSMPLGAGQTTDIAGSYASPTLGTPGTPMTGAPGGGLSSYLQSLLAGGNRGF